MSAAPLAALTNAAGTAPAITTFRSPVPEDEALDTLASTLLDQIPRRFGRVGMPLGTGETCRYVFQERGKRGY